MAVPVTSASTDPEHRAGPLPTMPRPLVLDGRPLPVVGTARVYVCGITPYDVTHLGHAATFVWADLLASVLAANGVSTLVARNVTDVDDVLSTAARERGRHFDELALSQEAVFDRSMRALRVATPTVQPRARHHVGAVQQLAQVLLESGRAYERGGTVWFRGGTVPSEAGLSTERARALSAAYGDEPDDPAKDDPFDVALWRPSTGDAPAWPSPWGWGRPGWHAGCAAMALGTLGASLDVLVGGEDLRFPHHAYQEAMVQAASGVTPFARARVHVGLVRVGAQKMAKSTGNLVLVEDVLAEVAPAVLRMLLLDRRHGEPWDYDPALLAGAAQRLERVRTAAAGAGGVDGPAPAADLAVDAVRDGLDVPRALDLAEEHGGECARRLLALLRLDAPA